MKDQLSFKSQTSPLLFKKFLLSLTPKTLSKFTNFGKITIKNVDNIVKNELSSSDKIKFFSFLNNELIGYSFLIKFDKSSKKHNCILGIVLADNWQKKGFGKQICQHMIKMAWENKIEKIWLTVYQDNLDAYNMYKKIGFEVEGIFLYDEKFSGKFKHKISMAIFKNHLNNNTKRKNILKNLD